MNLKTALENTKNKYSEKSFILYYKEKKLCQQYYGSLFTGIEIVGLILNKMPEKTSRLSYVGICTKQNICLPTLILGCIYNQSPFIYLDIENQPDVNIKLIESLPITGVFLDEQSEQLKCFMQEPILIKTFTVWDMKIQFWITGLAPCEMVKTKTTQKPVMIYAVQTTGSTGNPKIVQVPEQAILPNILDFRSLWNVTVDDVILSMSPPTFDPFMVELLLAVTSGAALLLVNPELRISPHHLLDAVFPPGRPSRVSVAQITPSIFTRWTTEQIKTRILTEDSTLRVLALGGEKFPPQVWWQQCTAKGNRTRVYNLYGITEVSCWAMVAPGIDGTLGFPLSDTLVKVVDDQGQTTTSGTGEMYIGSTSRVCLIEEETWEKLNTPVFRATGDLVSVKNNGYKFLERKGDMVKRWGHRVSLSSIETIATENENVTAACCVHQANTLALFICLHPSCTSLDTVKASLKQTLLSRANKASVPDKMFILDQLPLNRHGKTNKNQLKFMLSEITSDEITFKDKYDLFKTLWKKQTYDASEDVGFISAGGNSVGAMMVVNHMADRGFNLPMTVLSGMLNNKSVTECCQIMDSHSIEPQPTFVDETDLIKIEYISNKRETVESNEILYIKMKGSTNNILTDLGTDIELKFVWSHNLRKCVDASPTCIVYKNGTGVATVGSHSGRLAALQLDSGALLWEVQLPDRLESSLSPATCGRGLIGCYDGHVYCVSLSSGVTLWSYKSAAMVKGTALTLDDTWIFGSYDYHVYCLYAKDGLVKWKHKMDGIVVAAPLHLPQQGLVVVATLTGGLAALDGQTGDVSWSVSLPSPIFSTPCLVEGMLVVAEVEGTLHGLEMVGGNKVWQYRAGGKIFSSLIAVEDSVVFGCHDSSVYRVSCSLHRGPTLVWRHQACSAVYATPALLSPLHLIIANTAGLVTVLDVTTGASLSSAQLPGEVFSSPVTCRDRVVLGCRDNNFYCFQVTSKGV